MDCKYDTQGNYTCNMKKTEKVVEGFAKRTCEDLGLNLIDCNNCSCGWYWTGGSSKACKKCGNCKCRNSNGSCGDCKQGAIY